MYFIRFLLREWSPIRRTGSDELDRLRAEMHLLRQLSNPANDLERLLDA